MKKGFFIALAIILVMMPLIAFAEVILPLTIDGQLDYQALITQLIANPKSFLSTMGGAVLIFLFVQANNKYKFKLMSPLKQYLLIFVLGQVYSFIVSVLIFHNMTVGTFVVGFFSSGAAISLYNQIKLAFPKLLVFEPEKK